MSHFRPRRSRPSGCSVRLALCSPMDGGAGVDIGPTYTPLGIKASSVVAVASLVPAEIQLEPPLEADGYRRLRVSVVSELSARPTQA